MKPMAIGLLGAVMLMLGVAAAIANVSAGTIVQPLNALVVGGLLMGGTALLVVGLVLGGAGLVAAAVRYAKTAATDFSAATVARTADSATVAGANTLGATVAPTTSTKPIVDEAGQARPSESLQRDFEALYHLSARAELCDKPELRERMLQLCRSLQDCFFEAQHACVGATPQVRGSNASAKPAPVVAPTPAAPTTPPTA